MNVDDRCVQTFNLFLIILLSTAITTGVTGIKDTKMFLPAAIQAGQTARLMCHYDLQGATLYSVKWYRGKREFYRYVPKEIPRTKVFPLQGINVDLSESGMNQVVLRDVQVELTGNFSCEVSADAPKFSTAVVSHYMTVVDPPEKQPEISIDKSNFQLGYITANCTSSRSRPPANLTFYINDQVVPEIYVNRMQAKFDENYGKNIGGISWLNLNAPTPHHAGPLRLKCVASVLMFHQYAEKILEQEKPHQLLVLDAREQTGAGASSLASRLSGFSRFYVTVIIMSVLSSLS